MPVQPYNELDRRIVDSVCRYWAEERKPLLLSQLGGHGDIGARVKSVASGLEAYLRHRLADRVTVIRHSANPAVVAAIPTDAAPEGNCDSLLEKTVGRATGVGEPRFAPALWAAFRMPLDAAKNRYMSVARPIRFVDAAPEDCPAGEVEIRREYISDAPDMVERIDRWLEENNLDRAPFLLHDRHGGQLPPNDVLGRFLMALDPGDLERISIPLDIVNRLRREPL